MNYETSYEHSRLWSRVGLALLGVAAAALLALPASASAGPKDVKQHLHKADRQLAKAEQLVANGRDAQAVAKMARANRQARLAHRDAKRMDGLRSARGVKQVARQFDDQVETFIELSEEVETEFEGDIAEQVTDAFTGREQALDELIGLFGQLPEEAVRNFAMTAIAISADVGNEIDAFLGAIESGAVGARSIDEVEDALDVLEESMGDSLDRIDDLIGLLPESEQDRAEDSLDRLEESMDILLDRIWDAIDRLEEARESIED